MHGGAKLVKGDQDIATLDSEKEHIANGADAVNISEHMTYYMYGLIYYTFPPQISGGKLLKWTQQPRIRYPSLERVKAFSFF